MDKKASKIKKEGVSYWTSFSDMMAGLILIFALIITVTSYISKKEYENAIENADVARQEAINAKKEAEIKTEEARIAKEDAEAAKGQLEDIVGVRKEIVAKLIKEFSKDGNITIDDETGDIMLLSKILFDVDKSDLNEEGMEFLRDFMPRYISILMSDDIKDHITEIIIEGHTDPQNTYIYNIKLSQDRARSVAVFCLTNANNVLNVDEIAYLESVLSTNGKSYSEPKYYDEDQIRIDDDSSRRVEIKFRLSDEGQINNIIEMMNGQENKGTSNDKTLIEAYVYPSIQNKNVTFDCTYKLNGTTGELYTAILENEDGRIVHKFEIWPQTNLHGLRFPVNCSEAGDFQLVFYKGDGSEIGRTNTFTVK